MTSTITVPPAALDYMSKVHATFLACGRSANRAFTAGIVLNVVYLAYLLGTVVIEPRLTLAGVHVALSSVVLVVGVHWASTFIYTHGWAAAISEFKLLQELRRGYYLCGVLEAGEGSGLESPLVLPGVGLMMSGSFTRVKRVGRIAAATLRIAFFLGTAILPVVVQGWGTIRAWRGGVGALWVALLIFSWLVTFSYLDVVWHHVKRLEADAFVPE